MQYLKTGSLHDQIDGLLVLFFMSCSPSANTVAILLLHNNCFSVPYSNFGITQVRIELSNQADMSKYLEPNDAPEGIFQLIRGCLNYDSHQRPSFPDMALHLRQIEQRLENDPQQNTWKKG